MSLPTSNRKLIPPCVARYALLLAWMLVAVPGWSQQPQPAQPQSALPRPTLAEPMTTVDLSLGESREVQLPDGKSVRVRLVDLTEERDTTRGAVRRAVVRAEIDGQPIELVSANYRLPRAVAGVRVDCPVTRGYPRNSTQTTARLDPWGLDKDVRLRLWPATGPLIDPATFQYPARQEWFASQTQMANEPVYVDGGEKPGAGPVYYHYGLDIGGAEGRVDVVAATDGLVVSLGREVMPGFQGTPVAPRYDVVYLLDDRGWFYRYSHLKSIDPRLRLGARVGRGELLGVLGKEGGSGGWSHLHFDISARQPSGKWGIVEGYAFLWQAMIVEQQPKLVAVARPHHFALTGEPVLLDGTRSWSVDDSIVSYAWTGTDGETARGPTWERRYERPGVYAETLEVTDRAGRRDFDFAMVHVLDARDPARVPPSIHAAYAPTTGIRVGMPVTFLVRTFRTTDGEERWDFGDGSPSVTVQSDGNVEPLARDGYARTEHRFARPGTYLVSVERSNRDGARAVARLKVIVAP